MWKNNNSNGIHRDLDDDEEQEFRQWARANFDISMNIEEYTGFWHPVIIDECRKMIANK